MTWANGLPAEPCGISGEIEAAIVRHCSPVLLGCKPAALFTFRINSLSLLLGLLPPNIGSLVIWEGEGRALLLLFDKSMLEKTILDKPVRAALAAMGYPSRYSLPVFLAHLQKQFTDHQCPHEVGLFLGYPLDDVLGFIKHGGYNCKLCGTWKVYGDVERAKRRFRQYDLCRECMKNYFMGRYGRSILNGFSARPLRLPIP
jgi:hypothetical protein